MASNWGTGKEVDVLGFQKFTLRRRLKRIEQALEKQLLSPADKANGVTIEFNLDGLLRGDSEARGAFYATGLNNGWMTINEVRRLENLKPVDGGDVPRMQMQNVPLAVADAQQESFNARV
jgi:HK97 family phage portal protein